MPIRTLALALAAAAPLVWCAGAGAQETDLSARRITVSGTGVARGAPDMATASFTVQRTAKTARAALDEANAAMRAVTEGMRALGIESRDLQTSGFGVSPQYRYSNGNDGRQDPPELVGYMVQNSLTVRIRDIARAGEILDRAVSLGVNSGGDIGFDVENQEPLRLDARRGAVRDATATAQALAEAAGVTLGDVIRVDSREEATPPMPMARAAMAANNAVPVEAGETTVQASVQMVFAISGNR